MSKSVPVAWGKWLRASINKHFSSSVSVHVHIEGEQRLTDQEQEWIEVRIDGPIYQEHARGQYQVDVEVNVAICVVNPTNIYRHVELMQQVASYFTQTITIKKYGKEVTDDSSVFGYITLTPKGMSRVQEHYFGKIDDIQQCAVESQYRGYFDA